MVILTARTEKAYETRHVVGAIKQKLPTDELMELRDNPAAPQPTVHASYEIDKQAAARGSSDKERRPIVLRVKIAAYPARVETATRIIRDLFDDA